MEAHQEGVDRPETLVVDFESVVVEDLFAVGGPVPVE
jgi:hypothetical protein